METRKDRMAHEYVPKLHDYVIWHHNKTTEEGWVYYAGDEHISIEVGGKEKPICDLTAHHKHRKNHILLVCQNYYWHELEYVRRRVSKQDNSDPDQEQVSYGAYKSQQYRPLDVQ